MTSGMVPDCGGGSQRRSLFLSGRRTSAMSVAKISPSTVLAPTTWPSPTALLRTRPS